MFLWVGITTPMCFLGAYYGYKKRPIEHPGIKYGKNCILSVFSSNKSYSSSCPRAGLLYSTYSRCCHGRNLAIWLHFYPAVFHPQFALVSSNLLYVRFPPPCRHYSDYHLLRDNDPTVLLSLSSRGLQLVVEKFHDFRLHSLLFFHLRRTLLLF